MSTRGRFELNGRLVDENGVRPPRKANVNARVPCGESAPTHLNDRPGVRRRNDDGAGRGEPGGELEHRLRQFQFVMGRGEHLHQRLPRYLARLLREILKHDRARGVSGAVEVDAHLEGIDVAGSHRGRAHVRCDNNGGESGRAGRDRQRDRHRPQRVPYEATPVAKATHASRINHLRPVRPGANIQPNGCRYDP